MQSPKKEKHSRQESRFRASLSAKTSLKGIGIHSGAKAKLCFHPAPPGEGIIFRHRNKKLGSIALTPDYVHDTRNAVSLSNGQWSLQTVEHLAAALYAAGISDLIIEVDQNEIPIMDGSAYPFYEAFCATGLTHSAVEWESLSLHTAVWIVEGDKYLIALPQDHLSLTYTISYDHPLLQRQSMYLDIIDQEKLAKEILPARTFGLLRDVQALQAQGLIKGANSENALVLDEHGYRNHDLRYPNECLRHKILDLLGDLFLLGRPLKAHLIASKAGHTLDIALTRKILQHIEKDELYSYKTSKLYKNKALSGLQPRSAFI